MTDFPFKTLADYDDIAVPMKPTFLLLAWRHGIRASISSSQAVTWLGHWDCGPDAPRLAPVSPAANLLQSRDTGKSEGPASAAHTGLGGKAGDRK